MEKENNNNKKNIRKWDNIRKLIYQTCANQYELIHENLESIDHVSYNSKLGTFQSLKIWITTQIVTSTIQYNDWSLN